MTVEGRTVGVLGGMGPAATLDFMQRVQRLRAGGRDQDHVRLIVDLNPRLPDRNAAIAGLGPSPGQDLAAMAQGLERAGAELLVMPCNTAHAFAGDIVGAVAIPFLDMIEATADAAVAAAAGAHTIGVLATTGCLSAGLYQNALSARAVAPLVLQGEDLARFMQLVYLIKAGDLASAQDGMAALAQGLATRGAEALIAGCTEVPLVLPATACPVPLIDSTEVLALSTVEAAQAPRPPRTP